MPDEEVGPTIKEIRSFRDRRIFELHPSLDHFTREYVPGEVEGLIYALDTVVTIVKIDDRTTARVFPPVQIPASSEDVKAHGEMIPGAEKWVVAWQGNIRRTGGKGGRAKSALQILHKKFKGGYSFVSFDKYVGM